MTDYPWAYVGAKCVCVDTTTDFAPESKIRLNLDGLEVGRVYTIRERGIDMQWGELALWLREIVRPLRKGYENGYSIHRFRPLHTIESDAELFRAALNPTTEDIVYENALSLLDEAEREMGEAWANGR